LGFLVEINPEFYKDYQTSLIDGLTRTSQRSATIAGVGPAGFYSDAIALLGIALGAKHIGGEIQNSIKNWMLSFVFKSLINLPDWKKIIIKACIFILDPANNTNIDFSIDANIDIQLALNIKGINAFKNIDFDGAYHAITRGTIHDDPEIGLIASRLSVIDYLTNHLPAISLSKPKIEEIALVLNNLTAAFRRWVWEEKPKTTTSTIQKWDLQNEYHVQSLLYFFLAPLFPDIESEFYLENTGQLNSRADIGLPSLNLIIEVKFLRASKNFQNMLEEIAADNTLYFKNNSVYKEKYSKMLVFLWDDTNRNQEHTTFRTAVKTFNNIFDAVVMSRPGIMPKNTTIVKEKK
jgi:hypothetical protein